MTIEAGTRLGPYEVIAPIGAGGMGEVYKANDTRLDRTVAIKVLPEHLAESPERKARFEREAKAISQLNHPHICTLYDVGEQDGIDFIVMEYIEGETLAERLKKGALKLDQALEYGSQIADGLDKAHRAGIVHRDLKPGNVMLTKSGVKLLDFGLARLVEDDGESETSDAPTRQKDLTAEESIIGTLQYMAPEQLERKPVDARTDIFAFGAVLYEMFTGLKAFEGESQASLIAAIMEHEPRPVSERQSLSAQALDWTVTRCLAKNADDRWQTIHDLGAALQWIRRDEGASRVPVETTSFRLRAGAAVVAAAIFGALLAWSLLSRDTIRTAQPSRAVIPFPENRNLALPGSRAPSPIAVAPDGSFLVYLAETDGLPQLFLRPLAEFESRPIDGTQDARGPFFSPDSEWLGYEADGKLQKVAVAGGTPIPIADLRYLTAGASWGEDDFIVFADLQSGGLMRVSADGGAPETLTIPDTDSGESAHRGPHHLPGGRNLLFSLRNSDGWSIAILSLETGGWRSLGLSGIDARYVDTRSTGYLLYQSSAELLAVPFSLAGGEATGTPVPVLSNFMASASTQSAFLSVSKGGLLAYVPDAGGAQLARVDREGKVLAYIETDGESFQWPSISPDGLVLAVCESNEMGLWDTWLIDLDRGSRTLFTPGNYINPVWAPDGERIVVSSGGDGGGLFWAAVDGSDDLELLYSTDHLIVAGSIDPGGDALVYYEVDPITNRDLHVLNFESGAVSAFLQTPADERTPVLSPDGRFVAYSSDENGEYEVYVRPYPGPAGRQIVSVDGGTAPRWSSETNELFFWKGNQLMAVSVSIDGELEIGRPNRLFRETRLAHTMYDVAPDGQSFFIVLRGSAPTEVHVVFNWFSELEQLIPSN